MSENSAPQKQISSGKILKVDDEKRVVYGWASVIEKAGQPVVDTQGDMIREPVLVDAAHEFMSEFRKGGFMHVPDLQVGTVVESVVFTKDLQKALGISIVDKNGDPFVGWLIGFKVDSEKLWKRVKSGEFAEFSIGGEGVRIDAE